VKILKELRVDYAVTGAFAAARYDWVRATADVDIVVSVGEKEWEEVIKQFLKNGFVFRTEDFHMLGIATLKAPECFGVDLIVEDDPDMFQRAVEVEYYGRFVRVVSLEDLIRTKLRFRRGKDLLDLRALFEINASKIDWGYLERKVTNPEESDLLERLGRGEEIPWEKLRETPRPSEFCPGRR
jgi:hypothetical protein